MNSKVMTIVAIVLIALGAFGLARGKFSYTEETHDAEIAGIELSVKDRETVAVPQWLSIGAIVAGALLLVFGRRKSCMTGRPRAADVILAGGLTAADPRHRQRDRLLAPVQRRERDRHPAVGRRGPAGQSRLRRRRGERRARAAAPFPDHVCHGCRLLARVPALARPAPAPRARRRRLRPRDLGRDEFRGGTAVAGLVAALHPGLVRGRLARPRVAGRPALRAHRPVVGEPRKVVSLGRPDPAFLLESRHEREYRQAHPARHARRAGPPARHQQAAKRHRLARRHAREPGPARSSSSTGSTSARCSRRSR